MKSYQQIAESVVISDRKNQLVSYDSTSLELIGTGRSAFVFRIKNTKLAIKIFFPSFHHLAKEEAEIYRSLRQISFYPSIYETGVYYIVMDYIEGQTLFDCVAEGVFIEEKHIKEIDKALSSASKRGLNPSDIHLRNILLTRNGQIKLIDVARFRQKKACRQWSDLKKAYRTLYLRAFFPKKLPVFVLNAIAALYKKRIFSFAF
ncbi:protein kinase domain-containing protein [Bacillus massiliglaciei]|uniref:protein kinase domain-containing protein n=1 Tax=Bacillus massiliglaciei TaxID=1816693 RepID=UPI000A5880E8|nr:serine/threonine protein kinase [Bacillus massiliglaciei]